MKTSLNPLDSWAPQWFKMEVIPLEGYYPTPLLSAGGVRKPNRLHYFRKQSS